MIRLNDTCLQVGEIKQLLGNFNLPNCPVGAKNAGLNKHYIDKETDIYLLSGDSEAEAQSSLVATYIFNQPYRNLTSKLNVDSLAYDKYTHRYLGRYLRFLRDYKGIDLMSMYNCFDSEFATTKLVFNDLNGNLKTFDPSDPNYIIYQIPITMTKYTLGLQVDGAIDVCVTITNPSTNTDDSQLQMLGALTYRKKSFLKITLLDDLFTKYKEDPRYKDDWEQCMTILKQQGSKLRLYLKVPKTIKSSIVCLEGIHDGSDPAAYFPSNPQLLSYQNTANYLLADRMMEYLTGNAITPLSKDYDIKKLQKYLIENKYDENIKYGVWLEDTTRALIKLIKEKKLYNTKYDVLPYCDKDLEASLAGGIV